MRPTGPVYLNGVPLARELFTKWLDEDPYGTGDASNVVVDVHRPDNKGFGDAEAAADAWRAAVEARDRRDFSWDRGGRGKRLLSTILRLDADILSLVECDLRPGEDVAAILSMLRQHQRRRDEVRFVRRI